MRRKGTVLVRYKNSDQVQSLGILEYRVISLGTEFAVGYNVRISSGNRVLGDVRIVQSSGLVQNSSTGRVIWVVGTEFGSEK